MVCKITRNIQRKATSIDAPLTTLLERSQRLLKQQRNDKNKLYSIHEPDVRCIAKGKIHKRATKSLRKWMKRRAADEPIIGHLKSDYQLNRNHLKGQAGNRANVVLAAAAYNMAKLLAWFYCAKFIHQKIEGFIGKFDINLGNDRKLIA